MEYLVWSDAYSVGIEELDNQHMRLIGLINRLINLSTLKQSDPDAAKSAYLGVLSDMAQYAIVHFATEEHYLKGIGYADFDKHVEEHHAFSRKAEELQEQASAGMLDLPGTTDYLQNWLSGHILHSDMDYRRFKEHAAR